MTTKEVLKQLSGLDYVLADFNDWEDLFKCINSSAAIRHMRRQPDGKFIMWYAPVRIHARFYVESIGVQFDDFNEVYALVYEETGDGNFLDSATLVKLNDFT